MPEYESWPGQIDATRALFETSGTSKIGPHCYQHGTKWKRGCSWCKEAKKRVHLWEKNKVKEAAHEERLRSGEWSVVNLAIRLNDDLFDRRHGADALTAEELLEWAYKLAATVREQAPDVNYPLIEAHGQQVLDEFRAWQAAKTA